MKPSRTEQFPMIPVQWEPVPMGTVLHIEDRKFGLNIHTARELRDDMEEAVQLSAGYEKREVMVEHIQPKDKIFICGDWYVVTDILSKGEGEWCIQFTDFTYHEFPFELILPWDKQVTVYAPID